MAQCKVTISSLFIAGQKYRRGDIVEIADPELFGGQVEALPEVAEKPKATRKPRAKKAD